MYSLASGPKHWMAGGLEMMDYDASTYTYIICTTGINYVIITYNSRTSLPLELLLLVTFAVLFHW